MQNIPYRHRPGFIVLFSLLSVVLTFPEVLAGFGVDVDKAYVWAYNDLFVHRYDALADLVFPYGPLGFLKFPLPVGHNREIGFAFAFFVRFLQAVYFLLALKKYTGRLGFGSYLLLLLLLKISSFDLAFPSVALCCAMLVRAEKKWTAWIPAILLGSLALYIKFSVGTLTFAIFSASVGWELIRRKTPFSQLALPVVFSALTVWALGFALSGRAGFAFTYAGYALRIGSVYPAILSLHPEAGKIYLAAGLGIFLSGYLLLLRKDLKPEIFVPLLAGLFIVWKYAIVREEKWHMYLLVQFVAVMYIYLIAVSERRKVGLVVTALAGACFLWMYTRELGGVKTFILHSNTPASFFAQAALLAGPSGEAADEDIRKLEVPPEVRRYIGDATIDVFPWNLMYAYANGFNWVPRPSLQSSDLNEWLDRRVAGFYTGFRAPEFVLWHRSEDHFGRDMGYFEGRYLLNAGPHTIDALWLSYRPVYRCHDFVLLRKSRPADVEVRTGETLSLRLNGMVKVPETGNVLKADVHFSLNTLGRILSPVYKEPAFFVRYKWKDGTEYDYNILRYSAPSGVWVRPFITSLFCPDPEKFGVDSLGFFCSQPGWADEHITLRWQYYSRPFWAENLRDTVLYRARADVRDTSAVMPRGYHSLFEIPLDSLPRERVLLEVSARVKQPVGTKSRLVVSVDGPEANYYWSAVYNDGYLPTRGRWGTAACTRVVDLSGYPGGTMKIYFWNEGPVPFYVSDAKLGLRRYPPEQNGAVRYP